MTPLIIKNIKKFRKDLKLGKVLVGGWMQLSNSNLAEVMSDSNYNWIALDMEHGSFSIGDLPNHFRAIELNKKLPLVRLPNKNVEVCTQTLEAGCAGVIIPNIKNVPEFISIRSACYLPPNGTRGVGYSRANLFGKKFAEYKKEKTKPIIIGVIIFPSNIPNLNHNLLSGVKIFEFIEPKIRKIIEIINDQILIPSSLISGQRLIIKKATKNTMPKLRFEPILTLEFLDIVY